jgi:hypothetical protein
MKNCEEWFLDASLRISDQRQAAMVDFQEGRYGYRSCSFMNTSRETGRTMSCP